jgi:hypothetical protein
VSRAQVFAKSGLIVERLDDEEAGTRLGGEFLASFQGDDGLNAHAVAFARAYFIACAGRLRNLNRAHVRSVPPPQGVSEPHPMSGSIAGRSD